MIFQSFDLCVCMHAYIMGAYNDVHVLMSCSAERKMYARHALAAKEMMKDHMMKAKEKVQEEKDMKKSIAGGKLLYCEAIQCGLLFFSFFCAFFLLNFSFVSVSLPCRHWICNQINKLHMI